jgi:RimJ/RimL family protein N-acetyltransferase
VKHSFAPFDRDCERFLSQQLRIDFFDTDWTAPRWLCVQARSANGALMGVCAFEFKTWFDAHFSCAIADRRCLTRRLLRAMFTAVFSRARRVTAMIEPWNDDAIGQARRMGFRPEGYMRLAIEGSRDALVFGMLVGDCRYLKSTVSREMSGEHRTTEHVANFDAA